MFHITVLAVGRLKEKYFSEAAAEYLKRLSSYARAGVVEVEDEGFADNLSEQAREKVKLKEGERILSRLRPHTFVVVLDSSGKMKTSLEMAQMLDKLALEGKTALAFVIGGSLGLARPVLERADLVLSFSRFTFPHQLMRVILLEQLYRWFKIARGEPYHY